MLQSTQTLKEGRPAIWRQLGIEKELPQGRNRTGNLTNKQSRGKFPSLNVRHRIPSIQNCIQIASVSGSPLSPPILPHDNSTFKEQAQKINEMTNSDPIESFMRQVCKMGIEIKSVSEIDSESNAIQGPSQGHDVLGQTNTNRTRNSSKGSLQVDHSISITKNNIEREKVEAQNIQRSHSQSRSINQMRIKNLSALVSYLKRDYIKIKHELDQMKTKTVFTNEIQRKYEGEILSISYKFQQQLKLKQNQNYRVIQELKQKLETNRKEIKSLKLSNLQNGLDQKSQQNIQFVNAQKKVENLQIVNLQLKTQLRCLKNSINSKDEELSQLRRAQQKLQRNLKAISDDSKKQKQTMELQREQNESHASYVSQKLNKLINDKGELNKKIEELQIQNQELKLKELEMNLEENAQLNGSKIVQLATQITRLEQKLASQTQKNACLLAQEQEYCKAKRLFQKEIQILKENLSEVQEQLNEVKKENLHFYEYVFEMEVKAIQAEKEFEEASKSLQTTEKKTRGQVDHQKDNSRKVKHLLLDIQTITEKLKHDDRVPTEVRQKGNQYNERQRKFVRQEQAIRDRMENKIQKVTKREQALIDKEYDIGNTQERIQEMYQLKIQELRQQQIRVDEKLQDLNEMVEATEKMHQANVRKHNELATKEFDLQQRQERLDKKQYYVNQLFHELQKSRKSRQSSTMSRNSYNHSKVLIDAQLSLPESLQKDTKAVNPQSNSYHNKAYQTPRRSAFGSLPNAACDVNQSYGQEFLTKFVTAKSIHGQESMKPTLDTLNTDFYSRRSQPNGRSKSLTRGAVIDRKLERLKDNIRKEIQSLNY